SYSGCRQYIENIEAARAAVGSGVPEVHKLPPFWSHPLFVEANADRVRAALGRIPAERRAAARLVFTAHSVPLAMAATCHYEAQLVETAQRISACVEHAPWELAWQ